MNKSTHEKLDEILLKLAHLEDQGLHNGQALVDHKKDMGAHAGMAAAWGSLFAGIAALWNHK